MRTITMLFVVTYLLFCGLVVAQEEAALGIPTDTSAEAAPGQEAVEGAPGDSTDTEDVEEEEEEDKGNGGGNTGQNLNPPTQPVERIVEQRTVVVRQLAAAHQRGDQAAVRRLTTELKQLAGRLALVEANPLGGTQGQRSMWDELHSAGIRSESYLREHYGLEPVSAPEPVDTTPAPVPAAPQGQGGRAMTGTEWLLLTLIIGAAATAIALAGGTRRFFLRDPNREPAASAPAPQNVGRRRIVTESSRGDYSSEEVVAADVAAAEALASAERVAAVMEVFAARAAARRGEATPAPAAPSAVTVNASSDAGAVAAAAPAPQEVVIRVVGGEPPATPKEEAKKEEAK